MKKFKTLIVFLMLLSLVITAAMMLFMPDQIPAHYNAAGEITRLGSRFESLIWPAAVSFFGFFSLLVDKIGTALGKGERFVVRIFLVGVMLYFTGMSVFYMEKAIRFIPPLS